MELVLQRRFELTQTRIWTMSPVPDQSLMAPKKALR